MVIINPSKNVNNVIFYEQEMVICKVTNKWKRGKTNLDNVIEASDQPISSLSESL